MFQKRKGKSCEFTSQIQIRINVYNKCCLFHLIKFSRFIGWSCTRAVQRECRDVPPLLVQSAIVARLCSRYCHQQRWRRSIFLVHPLEKWTRTTCQQVQLQRWQDGSVDQQQDDRWSWETLQSQYRRLAHPSIQGQFPGILCTDTPDSQSSSLELQVWMLWDQRGWGTGCWRWCTLIESLSMLSLSQGPGGGRSGNRKWWYCRSYCTGSLQILHTQILRPTCSYRRWKRNSCGRWWQRWWSCYWSKVCHIHNCHRWPQC